MPSKIKVEQLGHCTRCSRYEATITAADGTNHYEESEEGGSKYEAIGRLIINNPNIFGEIEIQEKD